MKLEFIVLELLGLAIKDLLKDKGNISTRVERMLGTIRKITHSFKHIPGKKDKMVKKD